MTVTQRPSIRKVAEHAGVSRMTVSRVLNNQSERFSEETRQRVLKAVRDLEYRPVAGPMTQSRNVETRVLGLVFDGPPVEGFWGMPTFWGLSEAASANDYDLLTTWRNRPDWMLEQQELLYLDRRSDGFIFIAPVGRRELVDTLVRHKVPVVACYTTDVPPEVPTVVLDNADALKQAVIHLVEQGHKRILHLSPASERSDFRGRRQGYETAMQNFGLEPLVFEASSMLEGSTIEAFLQTIREQQVTAIACATDGLAHQAWDVLDAHGLNVPGDISLTGMDDLIESAQRGLTSVRFSCHEVGHLAALCLIELIQGSGAAVAESVVPVQLTQRTSVAAPVIEARTRRHVVANSER